MSEDKLTMTVDEYAAAAGVSRNTAYEGVRRGQVPHVRIGKLIRIPRAKALRQLRGEDA
jgi:excisionase family DNA binding protein